MRPSIIFLLSTMIALTGCQQIPKKDKEKNWQERIEMIDQEVARLVKEDEEHRWQANETERKSILLMRDDWAAYSKAIEAVEKDRDQAQAIEKRIKELQKEKQQILDLHQNSSVEHK